MVIGSVQNSFNSQVMHTLHLSRRKTWLARQATRVSGMNGISQTLPLTAKRPTSWKELWKTFQSQVHDSISWRNKGEEANFGIRACIPFRSLFTIQQKHIHLNWTEPQSPKPPSQLTTSKDSKSAFNISSSEISPISSTKIKMSPRYSVTEPHPTPSSAYLHCGRGGAGNYVKAPKATAAPVANLNTTLPGVPKAPRFSSGRGGAGNIHSSSERSSFSFDEELARQITRERNIQEGALYHVGRGGAGNLVDSMRPSSSRKSSNSSVDSNTSGRSGFLSRLSNTFERR